MSSIVKKGTLFVPKLKKNIRRRNVSKNEGPPTPSVTQESSSDNTQKENNKHLISESGLIPLTPEGTQVTFYGNKRSAQLESSPDDNIDPIDKTKIVTELAVDDPEDEAGEEEEEEYGDIDIFKDPVPEKPRRTSSVSHRRLSGIGIRKGSRSASISFSGTPRSSFSESEKPVFIQIPPSNKVKRRKSSTIRPNKRISIASEGSIFVGDSHEPQIQEEEEEEYNEVSLVTSTSPEQTSAIDDTSADKLLAEALLTSNSNVVSRDELFKQKKYIIYALNKQGTKLQQFRTGDLPPAVLEEHIQYVSKTGRGTVDLPLAPENVVMKVSKLSEIPRRIFKNESKFSQEIQLDPESFTMKDLCNPELPIGSISPDFEMVKEAREREKKAKELRRIARKYAKTAKISYESAYEIVEQGGMEEEQRRLIETIKLDLSARSGILTDINNNNLLETEDTEKMVKLDGEDGDSLHREQTSDNNDNENDGNDDPVTKQEDVPLDINNEYSDLKTTRTHDSSIKLIQDADGNIDINAESTIVHRTSLNAFERIREETNRFERPVISNTYSKRKHTDKWDEQEDMEFFSALSTWGTDFSMISSLFPHRTRKQIKSKYNLEEKKRPELVDLALRRKLPKNLMEYEQEAGIKLNTIDEFEKERAKLRAEHERQKKEILKEQEKAKREDDEKNRAREIEKRSGQKPIERLSKNKQLRSNEEVVGTLDRRS